MKMTKPEPEIFKAIIEDAGIEPKETLFIDDSEMNHKAAQNLELSPIIQQKKAKTEPYLFNSKYFRDTNRLYVTSAINLNPV